MKLTPKAPQQLSFASYEFAQKKRLTRREKFLSEMEQVVPWNAGQLFSLFGLENLVIAKKKLVVLGTQGSDTF